MYIITGGTGFLGSHIVEKIVNEEFYIVRRREYDLTILDDVRRLFGRFKGEKDLKVINCAAEVGGIGYNQSHPYNLYLTNLLINAHVIDQARRIQVDKFVQIGTTCSYPKFCPTPFKEHSLWDGYPEETNAPYGIAKRASLAQLQAAWNEYRFMGVYAIPTNLYGPYDTFDPLKSHVIPALIKKFFDAVDENAETVELWGTGRATRDFLHVEDAVDGILEITKNYNDPLQPLNLGSGQQTSIAVLAHHIQDIIGYKGTIIWNHDKPDGQPKRELSIRIAKEALNWTPKVNLKDGLSDTIDWYRGYRYG